jgi:hypothetical protein
VHTGTPLPVRAPAGVISGGMTVRRGKKEHPTGEEFNARLDSIDVDPTAARDAKRFRRIVAARKAAEAAQDDLRAAVRAARGAGDTWAMIGEALGIGAESARQQFGARLRA